MKALGWAVVLALVVFATVSVVQLLSTDGPVGSENLIGKPLPQFAAPLAGSGVDADSNVYTREQAKVAKSTAACDVRLRGAFNSCRDLKGRAVLTFWHVGKKACEEQVNRLDKLTSRRRNLRIAAVAFDNKPSDVVEVTERERWSLAVPVDRDGAAASLYGAGGCPSTFFASGGVVRAVRLGLLDDAEIRDELAKLEDG